MQEIWDIERELWLLGAEAYRGKMAAECLMAFGPMGVLRNEAIMEAIRSASRWREVHMMEQTFIRPADDVGILAYKAKGIREGAKIYLALCTSTYIRDGNGWKIAQHQQTPLEA
jgi:hypothetical protein